MAESPYFQFYASDWLAGTRGLSAAEMGVYITLLAMMYEREAPIDMDHDRLARLCGATPAAFRKCLSALIEEGKIEDTDEGLFNKRARKEIQIREKKREVNSSNANERWRKTKQKQRKADATASNSQCETDAPQNQNQNQKDKANALSARAKPLSILAEVLGDELAREVVEHRKRLRAPLGDRAAKKLAAEFERCANKGHAVDVMLASGWRGFEYDWYANKLKASPAPVQSAADRPIPEPIPERKPLTDEEREERRRIAQEAQAAIGYRVSMRKMPVYGVE